MTTVRIQHIGRKQNVKQWGANKFRARLLEPGIVSYQDSGAGVCLLSKPVLDQYVRTFIGKPLVLADDFKHLLVTPENANKVARGWISDVEYDTADGWWYAVGTVHDDDAKNAIRTIGKVSCAYASDDQEVNGEYHNIPYNQNILSFEGEHLAIVKNPRYETATIRLNAKNKPNKTTMFNWFKKDKAPKQTEQKQNSVADEGVLPEDAALEIDGSPVPIADVVETYRKANSKDGEPIDGESVLEINPGETVSVNDLVASYKANAKKKNEDKEEDDDKKENADEDKKEEKKENADEDKKEDKEEKKENSKPSPKVFKVNSKPGKLSAIRDAAIFSSPSSGIPDTREAKLARGAARYGSASKN